MTLYEWLAGIDDDYLIAWANKGLLRRGYKLLANQDPTTWTLDSEQAHARLDDWDQHLKGIGLEQLHCGCPAQGPCHHLVALLLGFRQRLRDEHPADSPDEPSPESASNSPPPWLIIDATERQSILGKAHLERARRWLAQGLDGVLNEDTQGLVVELPEPNPARVIIPRAGGLPMSLCSCREPRCAHRAQAVLQACRDAGHEEAAPADALTDSQRDILGQLDQWLRQLALQGMSGIPRIHIERARALTTELRQVDLPLPSRLLARVAEMLEQEWQRQLISSPARLREALAMLYAHAHALTRQPLPQPLATLAGSHRRRFAPVHDLDLIGVAAETWETLSGYQGYSVYFYAPQASRWYQLSEARNPTLDPTWQTEQALVHARFGPRFATALLGNRVRVDQGWCSRDGRLSPRENTQLSEPDPLSTHALLEYADELPQLAQRLARQIRNAPYTQDMASYALTSVGGPIDLSFDHYHRHWQGRGHDGQGRYFELRLPDTTLGNLAARRLQKATGICALFGRWRIKDEYLSVEPVAAWSDTKPYYLTIRAQSV